ncbi:fibronectin type III domain-containing protein [Marinimicrobium sp. ABcell2]|uniref:fibronectin type III domain-containing protein n=1 Tax=Marinimicrobium sp. ABcell2 TaxID=3069751 RepID=UPI0027AF85E8|nr:fibronectin type III domain-containing protein [Marinimicrobium sp. ABcell2]MDQ2076189.1 fibronectin type III domain-containing protein [Marinimicrobium sp. ABcell2]
MFKRITFPLLLVALLSACGGGNSSGLTFDNPNETTQNQNEPTDLTSNEPTDPGLEQTVEGQKVVVLEWVRPTERENGDFLEGEEIGGYEVRYRLPGEEEVQSVMIPDGWVERYEITLISEAYEFEIATYDSEGLYSDFVQLQGREQIL